MILAERKNISEDYLSRLQLLHLLVWSIDFHFLVEAIVHDQTMGDGQTVWFHWMTGPIVEAAHIRIVEIRDFPCHYNCDMGLWVFGAKTKHLQKHNYYYYYNATILRYFTSFCEPKISLS